VKARMVSALSVVAALAFSGGPSLITARAQEPPNKDQRQPLNPPTNPPQPDTDANQLGQPGGTEGAIDLDNTAVEARIDSTIQRMTLLIQKSQMLSKSFGDLAPLHEGADRSEIVVMQRMSLAMETMAGEIKMTLQQYKKMLNDETPAQTGRMREEVRGLRGLLDIVASEIDQIVTTLQTLQGQLGQG
jgi:hypothetical protein